MNAVTVAATRLASCPQCWQQPGPPCNVRGDHLIRFQEAEKRGLISREELAAVVAPLEVVAGHIIVPPMEAAA